MRLYRALNGYIFAVLLAASCSSPVSSASTISGQVTLCASGLAGVAVTITHERFGAVSTETDEEGNYAFYDVWSGAYTIMLSKEGVSFTPEERKITAAGGWIKDQDFIALPMWERKLGGEGVNRANSIRETADCGFIVAGYRQCTGSSKKALVVKLDPYGSVVWERTFGDTLDACAYDVEVTPDGGYVVAGSRQTLDSLLDFWLLKLDGNGDTGSFGWSETYGGAFNDEAYSLQRTADNGYIAAGYTTNGLAGMGDIHVMKVDEGGALVGPEWPRTYGGEGWDAANSIRQSSDGGYIVAGYCSPLHTPRCVRLMKLDSMGNVEWNELKSAGEWDEARSVEETSDGGYIVAGYTRPLFGGTSSIWVMKTDSIGTIDEEHAPGTWSRIFSYEGAAEAYSAEETSDGGYIVSGSAYRRESGSMEALVMKLDSKGALLWERSFHAGDATEANSIRETSDGGYILAGYAMAYEGRDDMWIIKLNENGEIMK